MRVRIDTSWSRAMRGVYCCKCSREYIFQRETSRALVQIVAMGNMKVCATTFDDGVLEEMVP
jgi:hypothetical protein